MTSSNTSKSIMDVIIVSEQSYRGYIDFGRKTNAFKAYIINIDSVNKSNLTFTWSVFDSSGTVIPTSSIEIYKNSLGISTSILGRNNQYTVKVIVSDGLY